MADGSYFSEFTADAVSVEGWFIVFTVLVIAAICAGVKHGVERVSKIMMPVLVVLAVVISAYSVTRPGALAGVKYLFVPNLENFSLMTVVAAMGQMFFSLSIAMGILYTYGSYIDKDIDLEKSTKQVEIFDTALQAGPSLMFITIPKVFASMGMGTLVGVLFFVLVLFAALTSAISLMEAGVSTFMDELGWGRGKCTVLMSVIIFVLGSASALGFNALDFITVFGMSILDFFDFLTNSVMMPIAALATCILILRAVGLKAIAEEIEISSAFKRKRMYNFCMKYIAPVFLIIILLSSIANVFGWIKM